MRRVLAVALALLLMVAPGTALARGGSGGHSRSSSHSSHASSHRSSGTHSSSVSHRSSSHRASGVQRDSHGKIKRDPEQRRAFMKSHPCPSTGKTSGACPGYVVDHVKALKHGGADDPSNMQWQTKADAIAKDKWE